MNPTPYLTFKGTCRAAITWYADLFGGTIEMMMTPDQMEGFDAPDHMKDWIMHSMIRFETGTLMASDDMMGDNPAMAGNWVYMELPSATEGARVFDQLADGGEVGMPYAPSQWAEGFGTVTDKFGTRWMISSPS